MWIQENMQKGNTSKGILAKRESKRLEFKEKFDPNQSEDWCNIVKHVVAMANSGGGLIVFGVRDDGSPSEYDVSTFLGVDSAKIVDKIAKYTGNQFDNFIISEADREGAKIAVLRVNSVSIPMVFIQPGTYETEDGKHKTVFSKGTVYFRHGAKSEPGNSDDLKKWFETELNHVRQSWLGNVRKVVYAPTRHQIQFVAPEKVWDESPYHSPQEIVIGALKSWRHDNTSYASESDIWTIYASRNDIELDQEKAECLLETAINRRAPFFFFAKFLYQQKLVEFIKIVAGNGTYPAPNMVLRLAHAMGGKTGSELLDYIAANSRYLSVKHKAGNLKTTVFDQNRIKALYGAIFKIGTEYIDADSAKTTDLEKLMAEAINSKNKKLVKQLDALLYGPLLETNTNK